MVETKTINNYLEEQGVKHSNLGFRYLITAISLGLQSPPLSMTMSDLYAQTAEKHSTDAMRVERAIRYSISNSTVSNKEFIAKAIDELNLV